MGGDRSYMPHEDVERCIRELGGNVCEHSSIGADPEESDDE
jgi:hypothetical protein